MFLCISPSKHLTSVLRRTLPHFNGITNLYLHNIDLGGVAFGLALGQYKIKERAFYGAKYIATYNFE